MIEMFRYLHYGLSAVLGFVGINMVADYVAERSSLSIPKAAI